MRRLACLALLLVLAGAARAAAPAPGTIAPDELGVDVAGRPLRVSDYRGRVVVASFWASWCAPCLREMALLENLQKSLGPQRLRVVGIDWQEDRERFLALQRRLGPLALQLAGDPDGRVGARYGVRRIPHLFIIDQDGRVASVRSGYDPDTAIDAIVGEVRRLLAAPPPAVAGP